MCVLKYTHTILYSSSKYKTYIAIKGDLHGYAIIKVNSFFMCMPNSREEFAINIENMVCI